jgi:predicted metal-dependent phosphotriesterase family hydrolase
MPSRCSLQDFDPALANGLDWYPPEMVAEMQAAGAANDWSMTFLFEAVIPALKEAGMSDTQLHTMLVDNPARWLGRGARRFRAIHAGGLR